MQPRARAVGGGLSRVPAGALHQIDFGSLRFDVVRFNHVLEHTQDPLAELRRAHELLAPEGILLISVPNLAGFSSGFPPFRTLRTEPKARASSQRVDSGQSG